MEGATKESTVHGSDKMNIGLYVHGKSAMDEGIPIHWHPEYEIIYVCSGIHVFEIEGTSYKVKAGQALFINRNVIHACAELSGPELCFVSIVFGEKFLFPDGSDAVFEKFIAPLHNFEVVPPVFLSGEMQWERTVLENIRCLFEEYKRKSTAFELYMRIRLLDCLYTMINEDVLITNDRKTGNRANLIRASILLIQKNFDKEISVKELATSQNLSHEYFTRLFRALTGVTPKTYINRYRIDHAASLILSDDDSVSNIAMRSGFEDINYFSRYFKKIKGLSPTEYRKHYVKKVL